MQTLTANFTRTNSIGVQVIADLSACRVLGLRDSHAAWSTAQSAQVFLTAIQLFLDLRSNEVGAAVFDKDDALAVEFVAAASNLRSTCYSITPLSLFDIKVCFTVLMVPAAALSIGAHDELPLLGNM